MIDDGFELRRARASRSSSSQDWTPADALRDALEDIEGKDVSGLMVIYHEPVEGGGMKPRYIAAGLTYEGTIAMLEVQKQISIREWLGDE